MKKILALALSALLLLGMLSLSAFAADVVAYVDYVNGADTNDGLSAGQAKKSIDNKLTGAMEHTKENGGTIVVSGKLYFGNDYTIKTNRGGAITITGVYGGTDYQNPRPASNPEAGVMKMAKGKNLSIATDVTLDNIILFHEYDANPSTIYVKDGATLTITDTVNCMSKGSQYYAVVVEKGGTAIINGGTFSSITGDGTIKKSDKVITSAGYVDKNEGKPGVAFIDFTTGNNANSGSSETLAKKQLLSATGAGAMGVVKYGGTIVASGKLYIGGDYSITGIDGDITITSFYGGKDYKNAEPETNPACAFKMNKDAVLTISENVTFDNIIIFNEFGNGSFKVTEGNTLTVTDTVVFMNKFDAGYELIVEKGAKVVLSEAAKNGFNVRNNGGTVVDYVPTASAKQTEVKLTVNSKTAYIDGKAETLDAAPINVNNRVMLPVRFLANAFGVDNDGIKWDAKTRTATLKNSDVTIVVVIDAPEMTVNGKAVKLDSPAIIRDGRTYLPVRAIANALGVKDDNIKWDSKTNTATLVK